MKTEILELKQTNLPCVQHSIALSPPRETFTQHQSRCTNKEGWLMLFPDENCSQQWLNLNPSQELKPSACLAPQRSSAYLKILDHSKCHCKCP